MAFDIRADGMVVVPLLRRGRRTHNVWPAGNRVGHEEAEMTDPQIEAACDAFCDEVPEVMIEVWGDDMRRGMRAALEALKGRWYSDEESGYESPDEAAAASNLSLGQSIVLSENVSLGEERWQLVPVTDAGELCPCGKPEGCGDFLGVECKSERDKAWRWSDLPKEWQR